MINTLAFIHTSPVLAPTFAQLAAELLPGVNVFHMVDESLIKNTISAGSLTKATARRVFRLIESAQEAGAGAALVTCSSIGRAVELARPLIDIPVLRVDEPMALAAVTRGRRIGVAATLRTTLEPTLQLLEDTAERAHKDIATVPCLCEGAFEALLAGQAERHDQLVADALQQLAKEVDVVVLAQASMARVLAERPLNGTPILSSPRLAVESVRQQLVDRETAGVQHR
jgi:Asp/Glu/hydantoin racemase